MAVKSLYKGTVKFDREQLVFVAYTILDGAFDRLSGGMPEDCEWKERKCKTLSSYERGGLEAAGMALGVLFAQLSEFTKHPDGLGIYDALVCADNFHLKIETFVKTAWADKGKAIHKLKEAIGIGVSYDPVTELYDKAYPGLYPDIHKHAEAFVDRVFDEYLADNNHYREHTEVLLHTIEYDVTSFGMEMTPEVKKKIAEIVSEVAKETILGEVNQGDFTHEDENDKTKHARVYWHIV